MNLEIIIIKKNLYDWIRNIYVGFYGMKKFIFTKIFDSL